MFFHHRDFYPGAGQQQAEHYARQTTAGDQTGRFVGCGGHPPILAHWFRVPGGNSVSPVNAFLNWWDGNELWLSGLAFVLQAILVMPVVLAVASVTAALLDGLLGKSIELMRRVRHADGASG